MNYEECKNECKKYEFECIDYFGDVIIKTKYEQWRFTPSNGKITLYHRNSLGHGQRHGNDYHIEFREWIDANRLIRYIYEHERAKYTTWSRKKFSYTPEKKKKQYDNMKRRQLQCML